MKTDDDAGTSYHASFKQLLPEAVKELVELSPVKSALLLIVTKFYRTETLHAENSKGRIGVRGATGSRMTLGTVGQFMPGGKLPAVLDLRINNYKLERIPDGFLCDIFFDEGPGGAGGTSETSSKRPTGVSAASCQNLRPELNSLSAETRGTR